MSDTLNSPDGDRKLISLSPRRRGRTIAHMTSVKAGGRVRRNTHRQKAVSLLQSSHRLRKIKCRKLGKIVCRISGKINAVFSGKVLAVYIIIFLVLRFSLKEHILVRKSGGHFHFAYHFRLSIKPPRTVRDGSPQPVFSGICDIP